MIQTLSASMMIWPITNTQMTVKSIRRRRRSTASRVLETETLSLKLREELIRRMLMMVMLILPVLTMLETTSTVETHSWKPSQETKNHLMFQLDHQRKSLRRKLRRRLSRKRRRKKRRMSQHQLRIRQRIPSQRLLPSKDLPLLSEMLFQQELMESQTATLLELAAMSIRSWLMKQRRRLKKERRMLSMLRLRQLPRKKLQALPKKRRPLKVVRLLKLKRLPPLLLPKERLDTSTTRSTIITEDSDKVECLS